MLSETSIELRSAKPSLLMRAIKWLMSKRKPVFPHAADAFEDYMAARDRFIEGLERPPASTLMVVAGFARPEFLVEVEAIAARAEEAA